MVLIGLGVFLAVVVLVSYKNCLRIWYQPHIIRAGGEKQIITTENSDDKVSIEELRTEDDVRFPSSPDGARKQAAGRDGTEEQDRESSPDTPKAQLSLDIPILEAPTLVVDPTQTESLLQSSRPIQPTKHAAQVRPFEISPKGPPVSSLMPPPPRPSGLRPLPRAPASLEPPQSFAAQQRALPRSSQSLDPAPVASTSTLPPSQRPTRKVILPPGHSPLDWAHLTSHPPTKTFLRGNDVPPHLIKVTPSQLKQHNGRKGINAWGTYQGKVYNLTPYLKFHPGGVGELLRGAGKAGEADRLFKEIHPWVNWDGMLGECLVGILVSEEDGAARMNSMEEMD